MSKNKRKMLWQLISVYSNKQSRVRNMILEVNKLFVNYLLSN